MFASKDEGGSNSAWEQCSVKQFGDGFMQSCFTAVPKAKARKKEEVFLPGVTKGRGLTAVLVTNVKAAQFLYCLFIHS